MWLSTVRTREGQSLGNRAVGQSVAEQHHDLSFAVGQRQDLGGLAKRRGPARHRMFRQGFSACRAVQRRAPESLAAVNERGVGGSIDRQRPGRPCARIRLRVLPIRRHRCQEASANPAASPARGPSTMASTSRNRQRTRTVTELGGRLQQTHLSRESPSGPCPFGSRQHAIDRLADGSMARGHPCPGQTSLVVQRTGMGGRTSSSAASSAAASSIEPRMASAVREGCDSGIPSQWHATRTIPPPPVPTARMPARAGPRRGPPDQQRPRQATEPPPGRSAACLRARSATSRASPTRPPSSSALMCASAMLNLMCGASKKRVATA